MASNLSKNLRLEKPPSRKGRKDWNFPPHIESYYPINKEIGPQDFELKTVTKFDFLERSLLRKVAQGIKTVKEGSKISEKQEITALDESTR